MQVGQLIYEVNKGDGSHVLFESLSEARKYANLFIIGNVENAEIGIEYKMYYDWMVVINERILNP